MSGSDHIPDSGQRVGSESERSSLDGLARRSCAVESHDYEGAVFPARFTAICPKCGHDFSLAYYLWWEAVHSAASQSD